ncbi:MAG: TRAFAC clade GTPase domain-containing protein [Terriglobales bacterium]
MLTCPRPECTVAETGRCLLSNDPSTCPERAGSSPEGITPANITAIAPPLEKPIDRPRFPDSLAFNSEEIRQLTGGHYHFLAGILGSPKAGKTAILVSLYLLAANGKLEGYQIADSHTLMGIDDISRGARRWNEGQAPEEMTVHTELPDERTAGFLHLRLKRLEDGTMLDLLLPDLPGEWSNSLIDHKRTDRLEFLKSADVLWLTIDGAELAKSRQQVLHRTNLLLQRIKEFLGSHVPEVLVVISHLDRAEPEHRSIKAIQEEAQRLDLSIRIMNVASFSEKEDIAPGTGLLDLLEATFNANIGFCTGFWPDRKRSYTGRYISRFRFGPESLR